MCGNGATAVTSMPTAPSSSSPASPSVARSRTSTTTPARRSPTSAHPAVRHRRRRQGRLRLYGSIRQRLVGLDRCRTAAADADHCGGNTTCAAPPSGPSVPSRWRPHYQRWLRRLEVPDIVANLRVDQAWGSAQIMGALHQVNAAYYITATAAA